MKPFVDLGMADSAQKEYAMYLNIFCALTVVFTENVK